MPTGTSKLDLTLSLKTIRCPVGIFQGGTDDQVAPHDAVVIDSLLAHAHHAPHLLYMLPRLNHLFLASHGGGIAEYANASAKIDEAFLHSLTTWMTATLTPRTPPRPRAKRRR